MIFDDQNFHLPAFSDPSVREGDLGLAAGSDFDWAVQNLGIIPRKGARLVAQYIGSNQVVSFNMGRPSAALTRDIRGDIAAPQRLSNVKHCGDESVN
jgi:hypothetical protein